MLNLSNRNTVHITIKPSVTFTCFSKCQSTLLTKIVSKTEANTQGRVASRLKTVAFKCYGTPKNVPKNEEEKKKVVVF